MPHVKNRVCEMVSFCESFAALSFVCFELTFFVLVHAAALDIALITLRSLFGLGSGSTVVSVYCHNTI